ncbi:cytochrome c biogenesis protein ResB [Thermoactinomyces mirandus]|uniref:Cytochrome c biogenesis protein ResB n=1 Tax=Thermoactinomyces mirandus TaxID=2756294 RepID=A0A7W1XV64_9BACL|nr:cytochrome c biogenesis protein ResB [Thermoactinomyces mirandus]MBA4603840.1 cytochrome c biogenesis protein ResB [Thermoactinomyces mirandus]
MIENSKCECGHNNPVGTILCEHCGKPLDDSITHKDDLVQEMRYEGKARRSQTAQTSPFDLIWNFFSSVKVAIILIIITLAAAGIGTIFPQEVFVPSSDPASYYEKHYGIWGKLYHSFGFSDMYSSWWFVLLVSMIGISLVICSLDRVIPLYKALKNQQVVKNVEFIQRQRISHSERIPGEEKEQKIDQIARELSKRFYHIRRENGALLAEKGRISRWGPYINHIGLIIFLLGLLFRYIPGWYLNESIWVREGEVKNVPETPYYVKNERFIMEFYEQEKTPESLNDEDPVVKKYQTNAVLYKKDSRTGKLKAVKKYPIIVNDPLKYNDLLLYQSGFQTGLLDQITFKVTEKKSKTELGTFTVNLNKIRRDQVYQVGNLTVRPLEYYPDFALENNRPVTRSQEPNRPAFIFEVKEKGEETGEKSWVISGTNFENLMAENQYSIDLAKLHTVNASGLMVRVDRSLHIIFIGGMIFMVGLIMGFYWHHRRVWVRYSNGTLYVGGHTNKNWFSFCNELSGMEVFRGYDLRPTKK